MEEKLDRRVIRTRQMLQKALMELVREKDYDTITVQDVTKKADVRRATFYLHYNDKEELLMAALENTFEALSENVEHVTGGDLLAGKLSPGSFLVTFAHVAENHALYRTLLTGQSATAITRYIRRYLAGVIEASLASANEAESVVPFAVIANYIAGSEMALIVWWLENDRPYSPEQMAQMTHRMCIGGVLSALGSLAPEVTFE
jgi:AcrR family transcriptional regulator